MTRFPLKKATLKLALWRASWYCYWRPGKGLMRVKTYVLGGDGEPVAISVVDQEHSIKKVFWKR